MHKGLAMRSLYDQDYLENGCPENEFDAQYLFDDLTTTWATNIVVVVVCCVAALKLSLWPNQPSQQGGRKSDNNDNGTNCRHSMIGFFASMGVSFLVATLYHSIIHSQEDSRVDAFVGTVLFFHGIATMFLALAVVSMATANIMAWRVVALVGLGISIFAGITVELPYIIIAINCLVVLPFAFVVYSVQAYRGGCQRGQASEVGQGDEQDAPPATDQTKLLKYQCIMNGIKASGVFFLILTIVAWVALYGSCGSQVAYESCFEDCPLSNPAKFNHNGVSHVLHTVGLVLLAIGEDQLPSSDNVRQEVAQNGSNHGNKDTEAKQQENEEACTHEDTSNQEDELQSAEFSA